MQIRINVGRIAELLSLGQFHEDQMQYELAVHYFLKVYDVIGNDSAHAAFAAEIAYNIGLLYVLLDDLDNAEQMLRTALYIQMRTAGTSILDLNETKNQLEELNPERKESSLVQLFSNSRLVQGSVSHLAC